MNHSVFGLFHENLRWVVGVNKSFEVEISISDVVIASTALCENFHITVKLPDFFDPEAQKTDETVTTSVIEPKFKMAISWKKSLIGR